MQGHVKFGCVSFLGYKNKIYLFSMKLKLNYTKFTSS